jgi:hypothetical protein
MAVSGHGNAVRLWDAATGQQRHHFLSYSGRGYMTFSADGEVVASTSFDEKRIRLRQVSTGKELWSPPGESSWVSALSADGKRLLTTRWEEPVIRIWDVIGRKELQRFEGHRTPVIRMALAPDGNTLASASNNVVGGDETLRVSDVATGKERWKWLIRPSALSAYTFSPDSRLLVTVGSAPRVPGEREPGEVRLWDVATGREIRRFDGHAWQVSSAAFSADCRTLATGSADRTIRLWEVMTGKERRVFRGHDGGISSVSFSRDGGRLASASSDGTVLVWNLTDAPIRLSAAELEAEWDALAGSDGGKAHRAIGRLAANPEQVVAMLGERLRPVAAPDSNRLAKLIGELDSEQFAVRDKAEKGLSQLGGAATPTLRRALDHNPSLEVKRRLQQLIDRAEGGTPDQLRERRAVEVLERIGSPSAKRVLRSLSEGMPEARLTLEALASLNRRTLPTSSP